MNHAHRIAILPALLIFALLTTPASAEEAATKAGTTSASAALNKRAERRENLVEQRIVKLHSELKITPAEAKPWNAFAKTMRENAQAMEQAFRERAAKLSTMTADEAMKSYAQIARLNAENVQKLSAAFSDLYAALTPEQKATADKLFRYERRKARRAPAAAPAK